jgi:hypothetical protein
VSDGLDIDVKGVQQIAANLQRGGARMGFAGAALVQTYGAMLQAKVRANASGRPGPRIQTGDYNRSISLETSLGGGAYEAKVYTNRPQAARLEYGFSGSDSLGRTYSNPPLPHFEPAGKEIEPAFVKAVEALAAKAFD